MRMEKIFLSETAFQQSLQAAQDSGRDLTPDDHSAAVAENYDDYLRLLAHAKYNKQQLQDVVWLKERYRQLCDQYRARLPVAADLDDPQVRLLITVATRLIHHDRNLDEYREDCFEKIVSMLFDPDQLDKLLVTSNFSRDTIAPTDALIRMPNRELISSTELVKQYITQLDQKIQQKMPGSLSVEPVYESIALPPLTGEFPDGFIQLKKLLAHDNPYPYKQQLIEGVFKPLARLVQLLNALLERSRKLTSKLNCHLEADVARDCRDKTLIEALQLILHYTKKSCKDKALGGEGTDAEAHPDWKEKLSMLLNIWWTKWCSEEQRCNLLRNDDFYFFFIAATNQGALFYDKARYFTQYPRCKNAPPLQCTVGWLGSTGQFFAIL